MKFCGQQTHHLYPKIFPHLPATILNSSCYFCKFMQVFLAKLSPRNSGNSLQVHGSSLPFYLTMRQGFLLSGLCNLYPLTEPHSTTTSHDNHFYCFQSRVPWNLRATDNALLRQFLRCNSQQVLVMVSTSSASDKDLDASTRSDLTTSSSVHKHYLNYRKFTYIYVSILAFIVHLSYFNLSPKKNTTMSFLPFSVVSFLGSLSPFQKRILQEFFWNPQNVL